MKVKIILAAAALVIIGAQIHYTMSQKDTAARQENSATAAPVDTQTAPAGSANAPATSVAPGPASAQLMPPVPPPLPEAVRGIHIFGAGNEASALVLSATEGGWVVSSAPSAPSVPADPDKITRFLDDLLRAHRQPLPLNASGGTIGLGGDGEVTVRLVLESGGTYPVRVGLRPEGDYRATFVAFGDAPPVVLESDLRGPLGLWRNEPGQTPEAAEWLLARPLRFEPESVTKIAARYPDHTVAFERDPAGGWAVSGYAPGGEHDSSGVERWLADLTGFTVTGVAGTADGTAGAAGAPRAAISLTLGMADGASRRIDVFRSPDGGAARAALDTYPGLEFALPDWRFGKYFLRAKELFPKAAPRFNLADIRLIDLRHGGESAKIARQNGEWKLVGLPFSLRPERVERLARLAAGIAPEDYADPGQMPPRAAAAGGPVLEVVLDDGTMHQYRLGGRHPLFAWRYVTVDSAGVLSLTEAAAAALFPSFGTVLDLGAVFPGLDAAGLTRIELIRADDGARLLSIRREEGGWTAGNERGSVTLSEAEAAELATMLPRWRVADFFEAEAAGGAEGMLRLRLTGESGVERGITLLTPQGRDIPYLADGERAFLLRRTDFFAWLGAVRGLGRRIDAAAEDEAARAAEAEAEAEAEAAAAAEPVVLPAAPAEAAPTEDDPAAGEVPGEAEANQQER